MDNLDNIIYFVILIVGLIASVIRKKPKNQPKEIYRDEPDPFEQIFGKATREFKQTVNEEPDEEQPWSTEPEMNIEMEPQPIEKPEQVINPDETVQEYKARTSKMKSTEITNTIKKTEISDTKEPSTVDFDLESAIIQTEILNRKY